ncbi:hypothetical protein [Actinocrispum sp. NPDC049592]|uniref:hypothetical protein n=1 Tax=Actinocrispum sp. NPDC049592 TaxID=3154835 RepID=UPI003418D310
MTVDDEALLTGIREVYDEADPEPPDLVDRVEFALSMAEPDGEILRPVRPREGAVARGDDEQARLITFNGNTVTIMVNMTPAPDGTLRVDGWFTPAAAYRVELRGTSGTLTTSSDPGGRFSFDHVPHGLAQIAVLTDVPMITPAIDL